RPDRRPEATGASTARAIEEPAPAPGATGAAPLRRGRFVPRRVERVLPARRRTGGVRLAEPSDLAVAASRTEYRTRRGGGGWRRPARLARLAEASDGRIRRRSPGRADIGSRR